MNVPRSSIPLNILEILMLHHIPLRPKCSGLLRIYARGTLAPVNIMLIADGTNVFEKPLNIPHTVISMHINT